MFGEHRDHRIGTTQDGSDSILFLVVFAVVIFAVDLGLASLLNISPVATLVLFASMMVGLAAAGGLAWRMFRKRTAERSQIQREAALEREGLKQKKIDQMLRANSRVPTVKNKG